MEKGREKEEGPLGPQPSDPGVGIFLLASSLLAGCEKEKKKRDRLNILSASSKRAFVYYEQRTRFKNVKFNSVFFCLIPGWCSAYPRLTIDKYGIPCQDLSVGDVCLPPNHPEAVR